MLPPSSENNINSILSPWCSICSSCVLPLFFLFILLPTAANADYYKYVDESGGVNVTNVYDSVPERYRAGMTIVRESDLQKKTEVREKDRRRKKTVAAEKRSKPEHQPAPTVTGNEKSGAATPDKSAAKNLSWLDRQLPFIKISALIAMVIAFAIVAGKFISSLVPRTLGIVIRIALLVGSVVYVFNAYSDKVAAAFKVFQSESESIQKTLDKRSDTIEKQAEKIVPH